MPPPILYSLRRCPYAMRARFGLLQAKQTVMLRDIVMKNIPPEMLAASPKGTVPVLVLDDLAVIDESINIMLWALNQSDPNNLLFREQPNVLPDMLALIDRNDNEFVESLEKYKVAARYHDTTEVHYREQCELFIYHLEHCLAEHDFLLGEHPSLADYALLPFIRQFSRVDRKWYLQAPYPNIQRWLNTHYENPLYSKAMKKYPQWLDAHEDILFGES
jgi:glutathione S-transferase